jgi:protein phosphatase 1B
LLDKVHVLGDQAERQRIQEAGGTVLIQRVNGSLAVSRALGDFEYKNNANRAPNQQLVSPEPEINFHTRHFPTNHSPPDEQVAFIVLACDGIWDVMTNEELATYILGRLRVTDDLTEICNSVLDMCLYKVRAFLTPRRQPRRTAVFFSFREAKII